MRPPQSNYPAGIVTLSSVKFRVSPCRRSAASGRTSPCGLRERSGPGDVVPDSKSFASECSVISSGEQVTSRSEVRGDDSVHLDEALGVLERT